MYMYVYVYVYMYILKCGHMYTHTKKMPLGTCMYSCKHIYTVFSHAMMCNNIVYCVSLYMYRYMYYFRYTTRVT